MGEVLKVVCILQCSVAFFILDVSAPVYLSLADLVYSQSQCVPFGKRWAGHAPMKQARAHGTSLVSVAATSIAGAYTYVAGVLQAIASAISSR